MTALNADQVAAVETDARRVLLSAVPGSGKTQTLAHRVARLIRGGYAPRAVCCLTFTRKASLGMRQRIGELLPGVALGGLMVSTFHALCHRILQEFDAPRYRKGLSVIDQIERWAMIDELVLENAYEKLKGLKKMIDRLFAANPVPQDPAPPSVEDQAAGRLVSQYRHRLAALNAIDLDDLMPSTVALLREHPTVASDLRARWAHVLVDEMQDTDPRQQELLDLLDPSSLFCVGDYRQAIYSFRGANPRGFLAFARRECVQVLHLETNYRSVPDVCWAANVLASHATERMDGEIRADRGDTPGAIRITSHVHQSGAEEADWVVSEVHQQHADGRRYGDIAVLARTNNALDAVEHALLAADVPVLTPQRRARAWDAPEVRWLVNLLRVFVNAEDDRALEAILRWPLAMASELDLGRWRLLAHQRASSLACAILADEQETPIQAVLRAISGERAGGPDDHQATLLLGVLLGSFPGEVAARMLDALRVVAQWEAEAVQPTVLELLAWYAGRQIADALPERPDVDAVQLLTVHAAKGLEWPVVIVLGLDDDSMPAKWAGREPEAIEEERRVLYVAVTRARDLCLLSRTHWSTPARGPAKQREESRFLAEMGLDPATGAADALPF